MPTFASWKDGVRFNLYAEGKRVWLRFVGASVAARRADSGAWLPGAKVLSSETAQLVSTLFPDLQYNHPDPQFKGGDAGSVLLSRAPPNWNPQSSRRSWVGASDCPFCRHGAAQPEHAPVQHGDD